MQRYSGVATDTAGNVLANAGVAVYTPPGTLTLATIYSDNVRTVLANPFTANVDGTFEFYAQDGRYDVKVTRTGYAFGATTTYDAILHDPSSVLSPPQLGASQNDYSPTGGLTASIWRLSSNGAVNITGIVAGATGQWLIVVNVGAQNIVLQNNNGGSVPANRIITGTGGDVTLAGDQSATLVYDGTTAVWRKVS